MWTLLPSERLRYWQNFRNDLNQKALGEAVKDTQHLWSYAPFVSKYLTILEVDKWPDPWELIYENHYCDLAKALGIVYTLYLSDHRPELEIRIYNDPMVKEQYNLVYVDKGKYVLNYIHDEVVNNKQVSESLSLVNSIAINDLNLHQF